MSTFEHYESHLGPIYSWMVGDFEAALARTSSELRALELPAGDSRVAIDLGAGIGLHAVPLAQMGYSVTAIDSSRGLLNELQSRSAGLPIRAVLGDLMDFPNLAAVPADAIVCMGDTLTHLPGRDSVETLLAAVARSLARGGVFTATFRDYASAPLEGVRRFIPVRSDASRILTCFLEYSAETVRVYDVVHERSDGAWHQRVSSYSKLRLDPAWVASKLTQQGLGVRSGPGPGGMVSVRAMRP